MKRISGAIPVRLVICLLAAVLLAASAAWAKPTTPVQAQNVVLNWLGKDAIPLGAPLGRQIKEVQTFNYGDAPAYYVVYLKPAGMVFLPADDLVEPIIGFMPGGQYDPSPANPLGALVSRDIPGRVQQARETEAQALGKGAPLAPHTPQAKARRKWDWLLSPNAGLEGLEAGAPSISEVRVPSFVDSRWSQSTAGGTACYNYYTPPGPDGNNSNFVSGCVATAMSQLMRYWQYPTTGVGTGGHAITYWNGVTDYSTIWPLRGGDGSGGAYNWGQMELDPLHPVSPPLTLSQRQAIGDLTRDAGLSVNMGYNWNNTGASSARTEDAADAFVNTFGYSNAKKGYNTGNDLPAANRNNMVNPNLHAGYPILFGITGAGGHAIVCDGYGYNGGSTMYHHLNLGWAGSNDAWYNLPTIDTSNGTFTSVYKCVYNVYPSGSGEIIAGRVTEANGTTPVSGVTVTATVGSQTYPAMQKDLVAPTTSSGIYAIPKVPPGTTFTVSASKAGYTFTPQSVPTGLSVNMTTTTGNRWGIDFVAGGGPGPSLTLKEALDNTRLSFTNLDAAVWYPETADYYYGGSAAQSGALSDAPVGSYVGTRLRTTVVGPGTLSFYWKVSSELDYDYLDLFIDSTNTDWISGEVGWTKVTKAIPAGIHTVIWQYGKDESLSGGSDCGWVDKVVYKGPVGAAIPLLLLE
jgi:hypothetical protein